MMDAVGKEVATWHVAGLNGPRTLFCVLFFLVVDMGMSRVGFCRRRFE